MRADIHDGQEHGRSIHGPDTEAQDQLSPSLTSSLQHTAGPYSRVIHDRCIQYSCRCYSDSDMIVWRSEVTPRAQDRTLALQQIASFIRLPRRRWRGGSVSPYAHNSRFHVSQPMQCLGPLGNRRNGHALNLGQIKAEMLPEQATQSRAIR